MTRFVNVLATAFCLLLSLTFGKHADAQVYIITQLDPPSTNFSNFSSATAINNEGVVVGNGSAMYTTDIMCIWKPGQPYPDQHYFFGYNRTTAEGINDLGQYVGYGPRNDGIYGFVMSTSLGKGSANDINNFGQVVGWNYDSSYIYKDGVYDYLPTSYWGSEGNAINDSGIAAGYWISDCQSDCFEQACLFRNDSMMLINLPGTLPSEATDINNKGQIVGWYSLCGNCADYRGFIWDDGLVTTIPTLGGSGSEARAINDQGIVVGESRYTSGPTSMPTAIIFDTINGLRDLNTLIPAGTGWDLWAAFDINEYGEIVGVGKINGLLRAFLLTPDIDRFFALQDLNGAPIPYTPVRVMKVADDPPLYTETFLRLDTTDSQGRIKINRSLRTAGKKMRFEIVAHEQAAVKGSSWFNNLYSIRLDNLSFDSLGQPALDTTTYDSVQVVSMNHTSIAINLVVSVQWNAELAYLNSLESGLRMASNYLYDVTNGQAYLDTVRIYDNAENWNSADIRIFSNNQQWPNATIANRTAGYGAFSSNSAQTLNLPRLFYFNHERANREMDWAIYPYSWTVALTTFDFDGDGPQASMTKSFCPSRTLTHELGHYFFGFYDEYEDNNGNAVWPNFNYGMMDDQLIPGNIQSSELSSGWQYGPADKQVNKQWSKRGRSCWDWFEIDMGEIHDGIRCPIIRPNEVGGPSNVLKGPNEVVLAPDYDIGGRLVFPVVQTDPFGATTKVARIQTFFGYPVAGAEVQIERQTGSGQIIIKQGKTNADGRIRIVGFQGSDEISADNGYVSSSGATLRSNAASPSAVSDLQWYFLEADRPITVDSFLLESRLVDGYFPTVLQLDHSDSVSTELRADVIGPFGDPALGFNNDGGVYTDISLLFDSTTYTAVAGGLGSSGTFALRVRDNSGYYFRIQGGFSRARVISGGEDQFFSSRGDARLALDSLSTSSGLAFVSMLSTPYPVIRNGLSEEALRVSDVHSISIYPEGPFAGMTNLKIRYSSDGLIESEEESIRIYKWDKSSQTWNPIGGIADIEGDEVSVLVTDDGTYAAFTTESPTGIDDEASDNLPYKFSVSQNYPNPFNPTTTIKYQVLSRAAVTIEIFNMLGQKVRSLVNEMKTPGSYQTDWNGTDDAGKSVSTGIYLYRFKAGEVVQTKKMLLLR